jgi:thioredoxin-related protein
MNKVKVKGILIAIIIICSTTTVFSQDLSKFNLYKPGENAEQEIAKKIKEAKEQGKHVFIQIGGNWCIWCARFEDFVKNDPSVDSLVNTNYVVYHLNYSKENWNKSLLVKYKFPQRFGFPVFLILNGKGELLHTQNSGYLEDGKKGYDKEKVTGFLTDWSPKAFDPTQYKEQ